MVHDTNKSEVAQLLERIELEYQAAQRALTDYACVAPHEFITARMEQMGQCHETLQQLVGEQEAIKLLVQVLKESECGHGS